MLRKYICVWMHCFSTSRKDNYRRMLSRTGYQKCGNSFAGTVVMRVGCIKAFIPGSRIFSGGVLLTVSTIAPQECYLPEVSPASKREGGKETWGFTSTETIKAY